MAETYRLYISTSCKAFLANENNDPNVLEAYLTDTQNRVLPKLDVAFFENKQKPKPLRHLLRAGKEVQICAVSQHSAPLPQSTFVVGKVFRVPELVYIAVNTAAEMSYSTYKAAESKAVEDYGKLIVSAQQANDAAGEMMWRAGLDQLKKSLSQPVTFEQIVKHLAAHLMKENR